MAMKVFVPKKAETHIIHPKFTMPEMKYFEQKIAAKIVGIIDTMIQEPFRSMAAEFATMGLLFMNKMIADFGPDAVKAYTAQDPPLTKVFNLMQVIAAKFLGDPTEKDIADAKEYLAAQKKIGNVIDKTPFQIADDAKRLMRASVRSQVLELAKEVLEGYEEDANGGSH